MINLFKVITGVLVFLSVTNVYAGGLFRGGHYANPNQDRVNTEFYLKIDISERVYIDDYFLHTVNYQDDSSLMYNHVKVGVKTIGELYLTGGIESATYESKKFNLTVGIEYEFEW